MDQPTGEPILVLSRKKPHLILFMIIVILSGLVVYVDPPQQTDVPDWLAHVWSWVLMITGTVSLVAHLQKWDRERGMYVERGALWIQSAGVLGYAAVLPNWLKLDGGLIISLIAAVAWAGFNLWEVQLIGSDLKMIGAVRQLTLPGGNDASDD